MCFVTKLAKFINAALTSTYSRHQKNVEVQAAKRELAEKRELETLRVRLAQETKKTTALKTFVKACDVSNTDTFSQECS